MSDSQQSIDPKVMKSRIWIWTTVAVSVAVIIGIGLVLSVPKQQPETPMPNPNGWDDFMAADQKAPHKDLPSENASLAELKDFVSAWEEGLKVARLGLQKEARVPTADFATNSSQRLQELASCKRIAQALNVEGRLAEMEGRPGDAAKSYLDTMRFGQQTTRGGLLIHYLVAAACERIGLAGLERVPGELNAQQCREVMGCLEKLDASREPFDKMVSAERRYSNRAGFIVRFMAWRAAAPAIKKAQTREQDLRHQTLALEVGLAGRAYKLEKGKDPQQYADLVPQYLKAAPMDPITGKELDFSLATKFLESK